MRAGILELGKEYNLIGGPAYYRKKIEKKFLAKIGEKTEKTEYWLKLMQD